MIYRLEIENFYSILDRQVIDLRIPANVPDIPGRFAPICEGAKERAPKVVVLFGANAAGKSNVLKSLAFLGWFIKFSFAKLLPEEELPYRCFGDDGESKIPTRIIIEFSGPGSLVEIQDQGNVFNHMYRYSLGLSNNVNAPLPKILDEALFKKHRNAKRFHRVFERYTDGSVSAGADFKLGAYKSVVGKIRDNASIISTLAQLGHQPSLTLQNMARSIFANLFLSKFQPTDQELAKLYANSPLLLEKINTEIQRFDLGIESMRVINISDMPALFFDHINFQKPIPWLFESHGTKYFIEIFPDIAFALDSGGTAVIDELDLSIHPNALPEILRWFHCNERNPYGAQIWMTCQNASLLEELEKEEVYFCEKDTRGATFIHGLRDIIGIRRSENFYKAYLGGEYGAVPHIG